MYVKPGFVTTTNCFGSSGDPLCVYYQPNLQQRFQNARLTSAFSASYSTCSLLTLSDAICTQSPINKHIQHIDWYEFSRVVPQGATGVGFKGREGFRKQDEPISLRTLSWRVLLSTFKQTWNITGRWPYFQILVKVSVRVQRLCKKLPLVHQLLDHL